MKRIILLILILILISSLPLHLGCASQKEVSNSSKTSTTSKIQNELEKCIEKNYQTDLAMANCHYEAIKKSEFEINSLLKRLKEITTKVQYDEILKSQTQWQEFIEQNNHSLENMFEIQTYYMPYLISATLKYQNVKKRLEELNTIYFYQKDYVLPNN